LRLLRPRALLRRSAPALLAALALGAAPAASAAFNCAAGDDATTCAALGTLFSALNGGGWKPIRGSVKYSELIRFCCSLSELGGLKVWRTYDDAETAAAIANWYGWWQKPWSEHKTASTIYAAVPNVKLTPNGRPSMFRREATLVEKVAVQLPGIDSKVSEVAARFGSVAEMIGASEAEWLEVKGVGKKGAKTIVEAIHKGECNGIPKTD
jgi:hypothetical protein